jgi:Hypoxia induced protein conserved region
VSGVKSFLDRDTLRSQKMMRGRVVAQLATIMCFAFYTGWENLDFRLAPLTQDIPEWEKKLEELQQAQQQDQEEGREKK